MSKVSFYNADLAFRLKNKTSIKDLIKKIFTDEGKKWLSVSFIFCSDEYLLSINKKYLNHNFYTDVITFPLFDKHDLISGEIYISADRIKENAKTYKVKYENELLRVIIHGILHLCNYTDKSNHEQSGMQEKENHYLNIYNSST